MYCPKCRSEYIAGVLKCAECDVALVETLPPKPEHTDVDYVCILSTFNANDMAMIESILEGSNVDYYVLGENFMYVRPLVEPVRVMVVKEQAEEAMELLKDLNLSFCAFKIDERKDEEAEH